MSASQEKRKRISERQDGSDKRTAAELEAQKKKQKQKLYTISVSVLVVLLLAFVITVNSSILYRTVPAVTVGNTSYNAADFNYYYYSSYYSFVNSYNSILSYFGLDTSLPLSEQECMYEEYETWEDYFEATALDNMKSVTMLCDEAAAAGYTLTDEDRLTVDDAISGMNEAYATYGFSNLNQYLVASYGKGTTADSVRKLIEKSVLAGSYAEHKLDSYEYSQAEITEYYDEHSDEFDVINYRSYTVYAETDTTEYEEGEEPSEEEAAEIAAGFMAEAKVKADRILAAADTEQGYVDAAAVGGAEPDAELEASRESNADWSATLQSTVGSSLTGANSEWLLDHTRKEGDTTVIELDSGYEVLYYLSRDSNEYLTKNARHILIMAEAPEYEYVEGDEEYDAEEYARLELLEKAKALAEAERIYKEWQNGAATEDSFAELANEYSQDTGSNTKGGLYENIYEGQMVTEFNDFCYAAARKPGDTGLVFGESSSYSGYHVIYFSGDGMLYKDYLADNGKRNDDYTAWETEKLEAMTVSTGFTFKLTK